jgi:serine/threonine protein kinase
VTNPPCIAQSFKPGDKLAGCYTLKELLAPQGFCCVWLAHDEELNKDLLLHFIPDSVLADGRAMTELKNEAKRNRQLIHPRIVRVHDLVTDEKWAAISMDYVAGDTYQALQEKREKGALSPAELTPAIAELCQTIEDAHRIELFHRDLSPDNLLATANGLMVQKFGISRAILDSLARGGQQMEGGRDLAYISPEQLDGERPSRTDDIYSLGATLYCLLTGKPPFSDGDIIAQIRKSIPQPVSERRAALGIAEEVPKAWDDAIAACLVKNFEERPKSAAELASRFTAGKPGAPAPAPIAAATAATETAATAAASEPPPTPAQPEPPASETPKAPEPEAAPPKQPKRPWTPGPGKAPVIAEATILSNTPVSKEEPTTEAAKPGAAKPPEPPTPSGPKKGGPTTPSGFPLQAFVEVEGDKRPKSKSSAGLVVGIVAVVILALAYVVYRNGNSANPPPENTAATTGSSSETASESTTSPTPEAAASTSPGATPAPAPVNMEAAGAAPAAPSVVAESPSPSIALIGSMTDAQAQQALADKAKAVDQAKAALAAAEKDSEEKAAAQTQAAAALQDLQAQSKQKADAAAAAKKTADDAAASLKQQQDSLQKAQADADAARKEADAKAQAAAQLQKAVQDAQAAIQQQQTAAQQAQADADQLAKTIADRQKAADDAAKAAADAEKARQQEAQALGQAQADLTQTQASIDQARNSEKAKEAADEAARVKQEREAETAKLAAQAAAAEKAAADAEKALDAAKKAVADAEKAQAEAEQEAQAAKNGTLALPTPSPTPEAAPSAPGGAEATPATGPAENGPTLSVHAPNPNLKVDQALINSLGMRFAPVGKVFFCIWLTRVEDFAAFAKDTGYSGTAWQDPGFKQGPDHPVVNVSWNDANQFCLWLTQKEHREGILSADQTYRLPTDLEWSNAVGLPPESGRTPEARDMDIPDVYPWGTQWPPPAGAGNYTGEETDSDVAIKGYNDGFAWTSPVGSFNVNKFGLYDMGGNVWEWCEDWWNPQKKSKVLRGGSWYNGALRLSLLSSCRIHAVADQGTDNYGFRVVISEEMAKGKHNEE